MRERQGCVAVLPFGSAFTVYLLIESAGSAAVRYGALRQLLVDRDDGKRLGTPETCRRADSANQGTPTFGQCSRFRCLTDMRQSGGNLTLKAVGDVHVEVGSLTREQSDFTNRMRF